MRKPPPKKCRSSYGRTKTHHAPQEFQARRERFKAAVLNDVFDTGIPEFDTATLVDEIYELIMCMHIFTKPGGLWYNPESPCWARKTLRVMEELETCWL